MDSELVQTILQLVIGSISLFLLIYGSVWFVNKRWAWFIILPALVNFLHLAVYYLLISILKLCGTSFFALFGIESSLWSTVLRLHGIITTVGISFIIKTCLEGKIDLWTKH